MSINLACPLPAPHKSIHADPMRCLSAASRLIGNHHRLFIAADLRRPLPLVRIKHAINMVLQLPLLVFSAATPNRSARQVRWIVALNGFDAYGLSSMLTTLLISSYGMIPNTLERAVTISGIDAVKFLSLLLVGTLPPGVLRRCNSVLQIFFIGNLSGMMAIAGMLCQDTPQRLCNSYLIDDQSSTGTELIILSLLISIWWGFAQRQRAAARTLSTSTRGATPTSNETIS